MRVFWIFAIAVALCATATGEEAEGEEDATIEVEKAEVNQVEEAVITDKTPFIATSEWQKIKQGQAIPPGLHVRMNLQTGEREAKILDPEENDARKTSDNSALSMNPNEDGDAANKAPPKRNMNHMSEALQQAMKDIKTQEDILKERGLSREQLKEALKKFRAEDDDVQDPKVAESGTKYRSMDELKKDLASLELNMKTDTEVLREILEKYRNPLLPDDERVTLLTDLEYYVHQIDNARDFTDMGGLALLIKDLNNTSENVRSEAAFAIGSATQSNPPVQIYALEAGALQQLIRMLPRESKMAVRSRIMYALSSIVRHFPLAQEKFLFQGGVDALRHLFNEVGVEKLQIKAVTLLNDMLEERKQGLKSNDPEKKKQYERIPLGDAILDQGWCDVIPTLLSIEDHDYREKVLSMMHALLGKCGKHFYDTLDTLHALQKEYEVLAKEEKDDASSSEEDMYFGNIFHRVNHILEVVLNKDEL